MGENFRFFSRSRGALKDRQRPIIDANAMSCPPTKTTRSIAFGKLRTPRMNRVEQYSSPEPIEVIERCLAHLTPQVHAGIGENTHNQDYQIHTRTSDIIRLRAESKSADPQFAKLQSTDMLRKAHVFIGWRKSWPGGLGRQWLREPCPLHWTSRGAWPRTCSVRLGPHRRPNRRAECTRQRSPSKCCQDA